ncbi:hypothetical protein V494_02959 [Pseudogymnoascus sp. VKM F-4513 (FW-928)]|nr:hypothetical protein V494_02959 [Pseudogymnoascus sp. VKM F-4513 (FW-928)]
MSTVTNPYKCQSPLTAQEIARNVRIRDRQRRSREKKAEYTKYLQRRLREYESMSVKATTKVQSTAQKVIDENGRIRLLLYQHGLSPGDINDDDGAEPFPVNDGTPPQSVLKGHRVAPSSEKFSRISSLASPTTQMGLSLETRHGLLCQTMSPYRGSFDIKGLEDDGFMPENIGRLFGAHLENWSPGAVDPGAQDDLVWGIPWPSVSFGHLENLPQQTASSDAKWYMHDILAGNPNSIEASGLTSGFSHISDIWQLPSLSAPQPCQPALQNVYPGSEAFNSSYHTQPQIPSDDEALRQMPQVQPTFALQSVCNEKGNGDIFGVTANTVANTSNSRCNGKQKILGLREGVAISQSAGEWMGYGGAEFFVGEKAKCGAVTTVRHNVYISVTTTACLAIQEARPSVLRNQYAPVR